MDYLPSGHSLLPHLSFLANQIVEVPGDAEKARAASFELERLPYWLSAASFAISELIYLQQEAVVNTLKISNEPNAIITLSCLERERISLAIDHFLHAARNAQNGITRYLRKGLSQSMPNSLSDLVKGLRKDKYSLPHKLKRLLIEYWDQNGQKLKDYRDLTEHHVVVCSDACIFFDCVGRPRLCLLLPDNPEKTGSRELTYGNPPVQAFQYIWDEFKALVAVAYKVTIILLKPTEKEKALIPFSFKSPLPQSALATYQAPEYKEIAEELEQFIKDLWK